MHLEQIVFFLIFGAVGLANMLMRKEGVKKDPKRPIGGGSVPGTQTPQANWQQPQRQVQSQQSEDERLRKFMEALGVPASPAPPPRKIARPLPVPVATRPQQRVPPPVKRQVVVPIPAPPRAESSYQTERMGSTQAAKSDYEVPAPVAAVASLSPAAAGSPAPAAASPPVDFRSLLRSPSSIRTAVILKEILGSPRGLQQMDGPPGLR